VCAPERLAAIPDVPTAAEAGLPGLDVVLYYGLAAPRRHAAPDHRTAQQGAARHRDLRRVQEAHHQRRWWPGAEHPEEHAANIVREEGKWSAMIKKLGLKLE
jgi:tripartite-type tricarboxylate transporter receptor subunit TctC